MCGFGLLLYVFSCRSFGILIGARLIYLIKINYMSGSVLGITRQGTCFYGAYPLQRLTKP